MKKNCSFLLGLGIAAASVLTSANAFAMDVRDVLTLNDGANGASTHEVTYDENNDITTVNIQFRFDGAAIEKVLSQASGVGSSPATFYASVDPHYGFSTPLGKGNFNYDPNHDTFTTQEAIWNGFNADVEDCSAYYAQWYGAGFRCDSWAYWSSSSSPLWQDYAYVEYKKDGSWVDARRDSVNFKVPAQGETLASIGTRLVNALGLESQDELVYGENWRVKASAGGVVWIYTDVYPNPTRSEYIKVYGSVETAFDYMAVDEDGQYVYQPSLEAALESDYNTVIVNKDTTIDRLNVPAGKTLIERDGEITITDRLHSAINGNYIKQDGESYHLVKLTQTGQGLISLTETLVAVGDEVGVDVQAEDGYRLGSLTVNDEDAMERVNSHDNGMKFVMGAADTFVVGEFTEAEIQGDEGAIEGVEEDEKEELLSFIVAQIRALVDSGESANQFIDVSDVGHVEELIKLGKTFAPVVEDYERSEEFDYEAKAEILEAKEADEKIAGIWEKFMLIWDTYDGELGGDFGMVYQLESSVKVKFEIPEELREASEAGMKRVFTIIRGHVNMDQEASAERLETTFDGESVSAETDKFSAFVVVYKDVPEEAEKTPETGAFTVGVEGASEHKVNYIVMTIAAVMIALGVKMVGEGVKAKRG